jgi:hypothetical protein
MALEALPRPGRVPKQILLSPKICLRWRQRCGIVLGKMPIVFRAFYWEASYRRRGVIRGGPGWPHHGWARPGAGLHPPVVWPASGPPPALVRSSSFVREK